MAKKKRTWEDITSYSRGDTEHVPQSWELRAGIVRIIVTRHIHHAPDVWLLACDQLAFFHHPLTAKDIVGAKREATELAVKRLRQALRDLED